MMPNHLRPLDPSSVNQAIEAWKCQQYKSGFGVLLLQVHRGIFCGNIFTEALA
jgi:hypothetical protein